MIFNRLRILYINLLMIIFLFLNMYIFIIIFFIIKHSYVSYTLSSEQLNAQAVNLDIDNEWNIHIDYDTDSTFYFQLVRGEYYLWYNCRFSFYFHGGETILNDFYFIDIILYKVFDYCNFKYIYKNILYKHIYSNNDYYFLYEFNNIYIKRYHLKYNVKLLDKSTYNILNNLDNIKILNNKKKYIYIKQY